VIELGATIQQVHLYIYIYEMFILKYIMQQLLTFDLIYGIDTYQAINRKKKHAYTHKDNRHEQTY